MRSGSSDLFTEKTTAEFGKLWAASGKSIADFRPTENAEQACKANTIEVATSKEKINALGWAQASLMRVFMITVSLVRNKL